MTNGLKREELVATNSMILHEPYADLYKGQPWLEFNDDGR